MKRLIQRTIYMLKRQYGAQISVYKIISVSTDPKTGIETETKDVSVVKKAVILPIKIERDVVRTISVVSGNKQLVMGGFFDTGMRIFIIDRKDVSFEIDKDSWIVVSGIKYAIENITDLEFNLGWMIVAKKLVSDDPLEIHVLSGYHILDPQQTANATII